MFRNIVFTDFKTDEERRQFWLDGDDWSYVCFQLEKCPESGKLHLQGYAELKKRMRLNALKRTCGKEVHFEARKGSQKEAIAYCKKEESRVEGPWEAGEPKKSGARSDLNEVKRKLDEGASMESIADEHFSVWVRSHKAFEKYKRMKEAPRQLGKEVHVFWGDAGTGKTRKVYDTEGDGIFNKPDGQWFDGYDGQEAVVFDDYTGDLPLGLFLKVLDRYPVRVPVKGDFVQWVPTRIYITSNLAPEDWYPKATKTQHGAIRRRLTSITRFRSGLAPASDNGPEFIEASAATFNAGPCT